MPIRLLRRAISVLLIVLFSSPVGLVSAAEPTATPTATSAPVRYFSGRVVTKNLDNQAGPLQEVQGKVSLKTGVGLDGILIRIASSDWQAFDTTKNGGNFKFSLSRGSYTVQMVDMMAQELKLTLDGKTDVRIEFIEAEIPPTPTPLATSPTATSTATPSPTSTSTPLPSFTPVSLPSTVVGGVESAVATPTPAPSSLSSLLPLPIPTEIDLGGLLRALVLGTAFGGALVFLGVVVHFVRR